MQLIGKFVGIFGSERFGSSCHLSAVPYLFHQIAHRQILLDIIHAIECTAMINRMGILADDTIGQRDIG